MTADSETDHRLGCVNRVPLFADLSEQDRRRVAEVAVTRLYARGERVHRPGALRLEHPVERLAPVPVTGKNQRRPGVGRR